MKLKFLNSKKYDEKLNLTRSSIKISIKSTNNDDVFKNKIFAEPWFDSEKKRTQ